MFAALLLVGLVLAVIVAALVRYKPWRGRDGEPPTSMTP